MVASSHRNSGQTCICTNRVLVHVSWPTAAPRSPAVMVVAAACAAAGLSLRSQLQANLPMFPPAHVADCP